MPANLTLTPTEHRVLSVLNEHYMPISGGRLGILTGLVFNSVVFHRLEKRGFLIAQRDASTPMERRRSNMHAYCYASGHIAFGPEVPPEALPIAEGARKPLTDFISGVARHSRVNDDLFVPGIPETQGDQDAAHKTKGVNVIHSKHRPRRRAFSGKDD